MRKSELQIAWKKLDKATEALELLANETNLIKNFNVFSEIVSIKEQLEILIDSKSRK